MTEKNYDSAIMQIAGNIAGQLVEIPKLSRWNASTLKSEANSEHVEYVATWAVHLARAIVAEVLRTSTADTKGTD